MKEFMWLKIHTIFFMSTGNAKFYSFIIDSLHMF